jgi:hypothetical protein
MWRQLNHTCAALSRELKYTIRWPPSAFTSRLLRWRYIHLAVAFIRLPSSHFSFPPITFWWRQNHLTWQLLWSLLLFRSISIFIIYKSLVKISLSFVFSLQECHIKLSLSYGRSDLTVSVVENCSAWREEIISIASTRWVSSYLVLVFCDPDRVSGDFRSSLPAT